uniref:NADH-ubiquinone oxidoreductase chain 2 n=1 Tax=Tenebrionoidea sp. 20 KM-2017 TaxID=2219476 RepID=A0A346RIL4_9CUCU|nr:NADH dehydrogenase subunit 2 [Tenebrionoidea sp. 20 KM-2017]
MHLYKIVFLNTMVLGTLLSISSYSWFSMWMGLEINMLSIIPLFSSTKNMFASEAATKYFMTQALASLILLLSININFIENEIMNFNNMESLMLNSALLTKLGSAPFHVWFPEVIEGLSWLNSLLLLTWQKIAPMVLIMNSNMNHNLMNMAIISSLLVSGAMALNQTSLRKIMAFSSINHIAWMLAATLAESSNWSLYFTIYSLISINLIMILNSNKLFFLNQLSNTMTNNKNVKLSLSLNFLSLGGIPPLLGFLPKWLLINSLIEKKMLLITWTLIMATLIMLFVYVQIMMPAIVMDQAELKTAMESKINWNLQAFNSIITNTLIFCILIYTLM